MCKTHPETFADKSGILQFGGAEGKEAAHLKGSLHRFLLRLVERHEVAQRVRETQAVGVRQAAAAPETVGRSVRVAGVEIAEERPRLVANRM